MTRKRRKANKHIGSSIDDFLKKEGIFDETQAQAIKEVVALPFDHAMKAQKTFNKRAPTLLKSRPA